MWGILKSSSLAALDSNVPSKMTSQRYSQPWINRDLKRLSRRKQRCYNRYMKTHKTKDHEAYKNLKNKMHAECKKQYNEYVSGIVMDENSKPKRLWSFIKSKRTDACGVSPVHQHTVHQSGILKLLQQLNPHKATGPDEVSSKLLKETSNQKAPAMTLLFQASLDQGKVPEEWKSATSHPCSKKETEIFQPITDQCP